MTPGTTASILSAHRMHAGPAEAYGRALRRSAIRAVEEAARLDAMAATRTRTQIATVDSTLHASAEVGRRTVADAASTAAKAIYGRSTWIRSK